MTQVIAYILSLYIIINIIDSILEIKEKVRIE